jgi:hypothetical protein
MMLIIAKAAIILAFAGALMFVIPYWLTPWWETDLGRTLMVMVSCEVIIFGVPVLGLMLGPALWQSWITLGALMVFGVFSVWRAVVLIRTLFRRRPPPAS